MALGNTYNNNKDDGQFHPTIYSPYRMNNGESAVDPTCITFSFWKNSLKIGICPKKQTGSTESVSFDMENGVYIYLNHTKARIFAEELKRFKMDPVGNSGAGVPSGSQGLITIHNGSEFGTKNNVIMIRKVDPDTGAVTTSFAYELKGDFYFAIRNYKEGSEFTKTFDEYKDLELDQIITLLEEYYKAMTCTVAYTVIDQNKYNQTRLQNRLDAIAEKLGLEVYSGGGKSKFNSGSSFFNRTNGTGGSSSSGPSTISYEQASIDDIY